MARSQIAVSISNKKLRASLSAIGLFLASAYVGIALIGVSVVVCDDPVFSSPCGNALQVSDRGGRCLEQIFELIEGRFGEPKTDADLVGHCNRFNTTERCIRATSKDCLQGLHKTATGAVASAARRFRQTECKSVQTRARYTEPLKCAIRNGPRMKSLYETYTGRLQGIRDLRIPGEEKLIKMCCLLNELDVDIAKVFDKNCPQSTPVVLQIVHAMTDDARNTLCLSPKCKGALDKVRNHKYKEPQNFIEPLLEILFTINVR